MLYLNAHSKPIIQLWPKNPIMYGIFKPVRFIQKLNNLTKHNIYIINKQDAYFWEKLEKTKISKNESLTYIKILF